MCELPRKVFGSSIEHFLTIAVQVHAKLLSLHSNSTLMLLQI